MMKWIKSLLPAIASSRVALVPEGWCLVREKPTEAHIESMCMRFDHSHGIKHCLPIEESEAHFQARRNFNRTMVLQLYEEATGQGFYKLDPHEPEPEPDWMETADLVALIRKDQASCPPGMNGCQWVSAVNKYVQNGSVCLTCRAIDSREPHQITACAKDLAEAITEPTLEELNPELDGCTLINGVYYYDCRSCNESTEVYNPERFDPAMHYCGRSLRCCP